MAHSLWKPDREKSVRTKDPSTPGALVHVVNSHSKPPGGVYVALCQGNPSHKTNQAALLDSILADGTTEISELAAKQCATTYFHRQKH